MPKHSHIARGETRVLLALRGGPMKLAAGQAGQLALVRDGEMPLAVAATVLASLAKRHLILRAGNEIRLSAEGQARAMRAASPADPFPAQHRDMETRRIELDGGIHQVDVNTAESPLGQLARRKARDGSSFLTQREFDAGERLRSDYTRAQIMPRLSANWESAISTGRRGTASGHLTDGALAARQRVEHAIEAVGPELSGVLIDVCCFLKGLELVEMERGWPARSAKLMLKSALGCLARHYDPPARNTSRKILSWGAADYRPGIGG